MLLIFSMLELNLNLLTPERYWTQTSHDDWNSLRLSVNILKEKMELSECRERGTKEKSESTTGIESMIMFAKCMFYSSRIRR